MPLEACARCASDRLVMAPGGQRRCQECGHEGAPRSFRYYSQYRAFRREVRGEPGQEEPRA